LAFEECKKTFPKARLLDPSEIAAWVMFLASPMSQALNGQELYLDHGLDLYDEHGPKGTA
jgi:enoyl-[acyl-carrier-protein] reductase (NADH)